MKGLKIIPMFLLLIIFSFVGALFVEANGDPVSIHFFRFHTPPIKQGLVVLLSMLSGMIVTGLLCSVELLALFMQNKTLKKKLLKLKPPAGGGKAPSIFRPTALDGKTEPKDSDSDPSAQGTGSYNTL